MQDKIPTIRLPLPPRGRTDENPQSMFGANLRKTSEIINRKNDISRAIKTSIMLHR